MQNRKGYEIIRFIERGNYCHASLDYVEGITLYDWVATHGEIEKVLLYTWIRELISLLVLFHRQRGAPDYGRLSPYNIVIMRKGKIALLAGEGNHDSGELNKYFTPTDNMQNTDVYCIGKIIQFIMAHVQCEPSLSKREEFKLQKVVKKCLETNPKRRYEDIHMIQTNFTKTKKLELDRKMIIVLATLIGVVSIFGVLRGGKLSGKNSKASSKKEIVYEQEQDVAIVEEKKDGIIENEKNLFLQAGIDYFLEGEEYEKSLEYLKEADIHEERTKYYLQLAEFMVGDKSSTDIQHLEEMLEAEAKKQIAGGVKERIALLRIYEQLGSEKYMGKLRELFEKEESAGALEELSRKLQWEYIRHRAVLYEQSRQWKEAADCYDSLCEMIQKEQSGMQSVSQKAVDTGVKYLLDFWEIQDISKEEKLKEIQKSVAQKPEIMKEDEFKSFINEKKIHIEEGKIWMEEPKGPDKREDAG